MSDLNARAVLTRSTATLTSLAGSINGGSLSAEGNAEFGTDGRIDARLSTAIRAMALEFPAGLRSEVDADLQLAAAPAPGQDLPAGRIEGTVTILRGSYREPLAVVTGLLANLRAAGVAAAAERPDTLDRLALDFRLVTDEDIVVDNNYGQFELGADLRVIGTAAVAGILWSRRPARGWTVVRRPQHLHHQFRHDRLREPHVDRAEPQPRCWRRARVAWTSR